MLAPGRRGEPKLPRPREGAPPAVQKIRVLLEMIKFSHSVFALPFALVAMLAAAGGWPGAWTAWWIVVAVVAARTAAMLFNRLADREFDARNPRTAGRALVTGDASAAAAWIGVAVSSSVFILAAGMLNPLCLWLSPVALAVVMGYSLMKRVTDWTHLVLGLALGMAPVGAWVAVAGAFAWPPFVLGLGVLFWVAGFDVLYACQDVEADRREARLHSLPKRLGVARSLALARRFHGAALALFAAFALASLPVFGAWLLVGVAGAGALMAWQHDLVRPNDLSRVNQAFFTANGMISLGLLALAAIGVAAG